MKDTSYIGVKNQQKNKEQFDKHLEEIAILGYTTIEGVFSVEEVQKMRAKLDEVYSLQEKEFGKDTLDKINELYLARLPMAYDEYFISVATNSTIIKLVKSLLGNYFVLHLQNGIINMPDQKHHQHGWHRDLPYQDYVSSVPLAISVMVCVDDFTMETGATKVIPHSHRETKMPSEDFMNAHTIQPSAKAGSIIVFDSMLYHCAGYNSSQNIRRGINHMYTQAILKQQINIPTAIQKDYSSDPFLKMLLGYEAVPPASVNEWRKKRMSRI